MTIAAGALLATATASALAAPLPKDPRVLTGKLSNGVTWKYRQHDNPPGKMALFIHVDTGSLNETDDQRGLAHFMEHMVFNGTENFAPGELIPYFESIGMEFGGDLNAFTSFDQTVYMIFLPNTKREQVDDALKVLSDYAFRALLLNEEIDKERGVILEESRRGKSAFQRIRDKLWPELFEGSRFAERLPIGDDDVIANAPRSEFVDYYRTWYRPENVTVVLVGDADPEPLIPLIEKWFGKYKPDVPARAPLSAKFKPFTEQRAMVVTDPEMAFCDVEMSKIRPGRPAATTTEQWRARLVENFAGWIMGRRFEERVNKGEASYRRANANVSDFFQEAIMVSASANGEPQDWNKMLEEVVMEVNRACEYGFTDREMELARSEFLANAERAVRTESTKNARGLGFQIIRATNEEEPVLSAKDELALYKEFLPQIQLDEVNATFRRYFKPGSFAYVVQMVDKEGVAVPTRDDVLATARAAWSRKVEPPKQDEAATELLAALPEPGNVVASTTDDDLGITSAWLSNGARVHHRFMDYKKDTVLVNIALAGGEIEETAENAGVTEVASLVVQEPATNRLTSTQMRDLMTGKNIKLRGGGRGDSFTISIQGSPEDLEEGLQEAYALLTDGKIEESAFKNWKLRMLQMLEMFSKMPQMKGFLEIEDLVTGGDPRRTMITPERIENQTIERAQAWFDRLARTAPIEVAVVGDIPLDKAMPLIERYVGSLPERPRSADYLDKLRKSRRPTGPLARHIDLETMTPQAMAITGFMGSEGRNVHDTRAMTLSSEILSSRLIKRIREDLSLVYSIRGSHNESWIYEDAGRFMTGAPCDPANVNKVVEEVNNIFTDYADKGPTEEELSNAKKQVANNLDTEMREPRYWMRVLSHLDLHDRDLEVEKNEKEAYEPYTIEQVRAVFKKYYRPTRKFMLTVVPKAPKTTPEPAKEEADAPAS